MVNTGGDAGGKVTLTGTGGQGPYEQVFNVSGIEPEETNRTLRYLWARSRIARLSDYRVGRPNPDRQGEITNLGLTYNLLTAYTSFIAVLEEIRNPESDARDVKQPPAAAQGGFQSGCR